MNISKEKQSLTAIIIGFSIISFLSHNYYLLFPVVIAILSFPFQFLRNAVHGLWMKMAEILGLVSQHVILTILFFLFLTPLAFLKRLFGKDVLNTRLKERKSTFTTRNHIYTPGDLINPW